MIIEMRINFHPSNSNVFKTLSFRKICLMASVELEYPETLVCHTWVGINASPAPLPLLVHLQHWQEQERIKMKEFVYEKIVYENQYI